MSRPVCMRAAGALAWGEPHLIRLLDCVTTDKGCRRRSMAECCCSLLGSAVMLPAERHGASSSPESRSGEGELRGRSVSSAAEPDALRPAALFDVFWTLCIAAAGVLEVCLC